MVTISICGDLVPTASNAALFARGEVEPTLDENLLSALMASDARVINLEAPLSDSGAPILKAGPALGADAACACGIARLAPVLALANNHILDRGAEGLENTLRALHGEGIPAFGAGADLIQAAKPWIFKKNGLSIGLIACCEREFSVAGAGAPGANPFDPLETPDQVQRLKAECDRVIVLYHGGLELYRYPTPELRKSLRKLAEKGADLIVCQHSHCVGCFEEYAGATIVYGQGNLLFDRKNDEYWRTALVVQATFDGDQPVQYLPVVHEGGRALLAQGEEARAILEGFHARSKEILSPGFVEAAFRRRAGQALQDALYALSGKDRLLTKIDRRLGGRLSRRAFTRRRMLATLNLIECEALREQLTEGLKDRLGI